jgi:hypothetical protein
MRSAALFAPRTILAAAAAGWAAAAGAATPPTPLETAPVLNARDLAGPVPLSGPRYRVDEAVPTDGFLATFTVRSDFGVFEARGPGMLAARVREVAALAEMESIKTEEVFAQGVKDSAQELGRDLKNLAEKPQETLAAIPAGVGRFFERTAQATRRGVQKIGDAREAQQGVPPPSGPGALLPGAPAATGPRPEISVAQEAAKAAGRATVDVLGYDDARRQLAKKYRVDPYTTNVVLKKRLDDVAWAAFSGGLGVDLAKSAVPLSMVISATTLLSDWVWDTPPNDLRLALERSLLAMGVARETVDLFLRHRAYPLTVQAALVRALDRLKETPGRAAVLPLAVTVLTEEQGRFVAGAAELLARHHETVEPIVRLEVDATVMGRTRDGGVVIPAPTDYLALTQGLQRFAIREDLRKMRRTLVMTGQLSPAARAELSRRGWAIRETTLTGGQ